MLTFCELNKKFLDVQEIYIVFCFLIEGPQLLISPPAKIEQKFLVFNGQFFDVASVGKQILQKDSNNVTIIQVFILVIIDGCLHLLFQLILFLHLLEISFLHFLAFYNIHLRNVLIMVKNSGLRFLFIEIKSVFVKLRC